MVKRAYPNRMAEAENPALDRIERALARIEAAAVRRTSDSDALQRRHAALRDKIGEAIGALDSLIARQGAD